MRRYGLMWQGVVFASLALWPQVACSTQTGSGPDLVGLTNPAGAAWDPARGVYFVCDHPTGQVFRVDLMGNVTLELTLEPFVQGIEVVGNDLCYFLKDDSVLYSRSLVPPHPLTGSLDTGIVQHTGLAFDQSSLWIVAREAGSDGKDLIVRLLPDGSPDPLFRADSPFTLESGEATVDLCWVGPWLYCTAENGHARRGRLFGAKLVWQDATCFDIRVPNGAAGGVASDGAELRIADANSFDRYPLAFPIESTVPLALNNSNGLVWDPDHAVLWVNDHITGEIYQIASGVRSATPTFDVGSLIQGMAYKDGCLYYFVKDDPVLHAIDVVTGLNCGSLTTPTSQHTGVAAKDGRFWMVARNAGSGGQDLIVRLTESGDFDPLYRFDSPQVLTPGQATIGICWDGDTLYCTGETGHVLRGRLYGASIVWDECFDYSVCSGNAGGVAHDGNRLFVIDNSTSEMTAHCVHESCAAMEGTVDVCDAGSPVDVLRVNGSAGDGGRSAYISRGTAVELTIAAPPANAAVGQSAQYVLYVKKGTPSINGVEQPFGIGATAIETPISTVGTRTVTLCSSFPATMDEFFGRPRLRTAVASPEGTLVFRRASGFAKPVTLTFQGLIVDFCAGNSLGLSITNAVVLQTF